MLATPTRRSITIHFMSDFIGEGLKNNRYLTSLIIPAVTSFLSSINQQDGFRIKNGWRGKEARPAEEGTGLGRRLGGLVMLGQRGQTDWVEWDGTE